PASPDYLDLGTGRIVAEVLDHLAAAGGSRVAAVLGTDRNEWNLDAETAYLDWVRARGQRPLAVRRAEVAGEAGGREAGEELFGMAEPPDAVYCQTGRHAAGVLAAARARGLAVPGDVRIACGADSDSEHTRSSVPPITSVDLRPVRLARTAVAVLADRVEGIEPPVPGPAEYELIVRGSTRG
ncbi:substrate-binding domain-containing protein, partial [Amycolatopsis sp. NPDC000746]